MDGTALGGQICVDEGTITGEPVPVPKFPGGTVIARTLDGTGPLRVTATKVGADTVLAQIISMAEQAQGARLPIQGMIARIFAWFEPAVPVDRCTDVRMWLIFGPDPALPMALVAGVLVLFLASLCAMGLATPISIRAAPDAPPNGCAVSQGRRAIRVAGNPRRGL